MLNFLGADSHNGTCISSTTQLQHVKTVVPDAVNNTVDGTSLEL